MLQAATYNANRPAIHTETRTLTFREAWERGIRLANGLIAMGVKPGARVAGLDDNTLGAADLLIGCVIAGAVRVPLYPRNSRPAHAYMLAHTQCEVLIAEEPYAKDVLGLDQEVEGLRHVIVRDASYEQWLGSQSDMLPEVTVKPDDWYIIRHSGGTTGRPKGVGYTHQDWLLCCRNWFEGMPPLKPSSAIGHAGPISHASGYFFLPGWLCGAVNVLFGVFDPVKVVNLMDTTHVTHMVVVPSILQLLAREQERQPRELKSLQAMLVGGAPITDTTTLAGRRAFGDRLYSIFGQTEAVPIALMGPDQWFSEVEGSTPLRAVGRIRPFALVEIRSEDGKALPIGSEGEIVAQVEGQMHGFWGEEELTKSRLVNGWVRTGDIGKIDENGFLYVLDRVDDMIITGGFNVWPAELETVIAEHPAVLEVAVFAVPHEKWGESPMALCSVKAGVPITEEEVIAMCATRLGGYKKPTKVEFTKEPLPKTVVGKLQRKVLREKYWVGHDRRIAGVY